MDYKIIDNILRDCKKKRHNNNYMGLLMNAHALLEYSEELMNFSVEQEFMYRKFEANLSQEVNSFTNKLNTATYAETQAKATDYYKEWQRAVRYEQLIHEIINVAKKLASSVLVHEKI